MRCLLYICIYQCKRIHLGKLSALFFLSQYSFWENYYRDSCCPYVFTNLRKVPFCMNIASRMWPRGPTIDWEYQICTRCEIAGLWCIFCCCFKIVQPFKKCGSDTEGVLGRHRAESITRQEEAHSSNVSKSCKTDTSGILSPLGHKTIMKLMNIVTSYSVIITLWHIQKIENLNIFSRETTFH